MAIDGTWWLGPRIEVRDLFAREHEETMALLRVLSDEEWQWPTGCPGWRVRDIAGHVLGDHLNRLARSRDRYPDGPRPRSEEPFPSFIDRLNEEWVATTRAWSTRMLVDLLGHVGPQIVEHWRTVDLDALGEPVTWAGPDPAPVWLDAARDLTEYWTHQQQIRDATGRPGFTQPEVVHTVLDTFLRALPYTLRDVPAAEGTRLLFTVTGPGGGDWSCVYRRGGWMVERAGAQRPDAAVELDADTTWRLCTRGITPDEAARRGSRHGDVHLTGTALTVLSVIR
ncbi:uncharacterized protein (TIGR03083 family) [Lipingzhangella halophila]|uniref:Uncharacterized protein (TIGR03083 family) n=1 Tax=Lipingzhangella halophila TaxID=1783352 RepID=A0A7W7W5M9_9ACTN|nr:maleylpyruvate isomerase family mycothiol-dependent enzyme [Lipingzhangella halophila]MBB4934951.1 uncharacterized protein (TIGR03083 family) [Lipingzhangella halophila]